MKTVQHPGTESSSWDYARRQPESQPDEQVYRQKATSSKQPLLEFSGACVPARRTPYAKLVTRLFGDRMMIANATGFLRMGRQRTVHAVHDQCRRPRPGMGQQPLRR